MRKSIVVAIAAIGLALATCSATENNRHLARVVSSFAWEQDGELFGGWSGIEVSADGMRFVALSDRAHFIEGQFVRDGDRLTGINAGPLQALPRLDSNGERRFGGDSEGLVVTADGRMFVSFEFSHQVWGYGGIGTDPKPLPQHPDFSAMQSNSSLEALAIGPDGALFTLPERSGAHDQPFPVYRYAEREWEQPFSIPRRGKYLPVGADFGPDGRFYLLERNFGGPRGLFGFSTRIRRFDLGGEGLSNETLLFESVLRTLGNLEGISVWRAPSGAIRLTMIADDNFNFLQSTEIVELEVTQ